jgi:hypothetical protein
VGRCRHRAEDERDERQAWRDRRPDPRRGFNLGVELGRLVVVGVALPLLFSLRGTRGWSSAVNYACSGACGVLGAVWLAQRLL